MLAEYKEVVDRLASKWASAADKVPAPIISKASKLFPDLGACAFCMKLHCTIHFFSKFQSMF